eukprot:Rmarinus@m.1583
MSSFFDDNDAFNQLAIAAESEENNSAFPSADEDYLKRLQARLERIKRPKPNRKSSDVVELEGGVSSIIGETSIDLAILATAPTDPRACLVDQTMERSDEELKGRRVESGEMQICARCCAWCR